MPKVKSSQHFFARSHERHLSPWVLDFILSYGSEVRARGATHLTVLERYLPAALRNTALARQARDWIVILDDCDRLLTCYRHRHASRYLRRKPKSRQRGDARLGTLTTARPAACACG